MFGFHVDGSGVWGKRYWGDGVVGVRRVAVIRGGHTVPRLTPDTLTFPDVPLRRTSDWQSAVLANRGSGPDV